MPFLILAAVILVVLALFYFRRTAVVRRCRWRAGGGAGGQLSRWRCEACGVEAYSSDGHPPKECKRVLKGGL